MSYYLLPCIFEKNLMHCYDVHKILYSLLLQKKFSVFSFNTDRRPPRCDARNIALIALIVLDIHPNNSAFG